MSAGIRALTWALLALPIVFLVLGLLRPEAAVVLIPIGIFVAATYASVWLWWRPSFFEVSAEGLRIRFPLRERRLPARDLRGARQLAGSVFREEFGFAIRIGAGGLWGGFGWLWTSRRGLAEFYVSRLDGFVLIERRNGRPLLVTPADPEGMAGALAGIGAKANA
jgi:hypothetical protein